MGGCEECEKGKSLDFCFEMFGFSTDMFGCCSKSVGFCIENVGFCFENVDFGRTWKRRGGGVTICIKIR